MYNSFLKDMNKEAKRIENEISLDLTDNFILYVNYDRLLKIYGIAAGIDGLIYMITYGIYGYLGISLESVFGTITFSSVLAGGLFGLGFGIVVGLILIFGTRYFYKLICKITNKKQ